MKYVFFAAMGLLIALVASCTTTGTSPATSLPKLALETKLADMLIQTGQPQDVVISADLNEEEVNLVIAAIDHYNVVREKWKVAGADPATLAASIFNLELDYETLVNYYEEVQTIVNKHWDDYSPEDQVKLSGYHRQAISIDATVRQLLAARNASETINMVMQYGLLIAQIAL